MSCYLLKSEREREREKGKVGEREREKYNKELSSSIFTRKQN